MGHGFDYAKEFESLDLDAVIKDSHGGGGAFQRVRVQGLGL